MRDRHLDKQQQQSPYTSGIPTQSPPLTRGIQTPLSQSLLTRGISTQSPLTRGISQRMEGLQLGGLF